MHKGLGMTLVPSILFIKASIQTTDMGRKLIRRVPTEQDLSKKLPKGHIAIVAAQHVLLYSSGYVIASTAYLVHTSTITKDLLPAAVILVFAVRIHEGFLHLAKADNLRDVHRSLASAFATQQHGVHPDRSGKAF